MPLNAPSDGGTCLHFTPANLRAAGAHLGNKDGNARLCEREQNNKVLGLTLLFKVKRNKGVFPWQMSASLRLKYQGFDGSETTFNSQYEQQTTAMKPVIKKCQTRTNSLSNSELFAALLSCRYEINLHIIINGFNLSLILHIFKHHLHSDDILKCWHFVASGT